MRTKIVIITHKNLQLYLDKLACEPYFQSGFDVGYDPDAWFEKEVILEFAAEALLEDGLTTLALVGRCPWRIVVIIGTEKFGVNGLGGKMQVRKPLVNALFNLRDLLPRGRIVVGAKFDDGQARWLPGLRTFEQEESSGRLVE
jgi:hypothetical protein